MNRKHLYLSCFCLLYCTPLTGCWDRTEVNDVALVAGTSIDKAGDKYRVSIQVPLPGQMGGAGSTGGGGGTGGTGPWQMEMAEGKTIREANEKQQRSISRRLNFSHRRIVLWGEKLAKEGVSPMMDTLARVPDNRMSTLLAVTKGPAEKILNSDAPYEKLPAEMCRELVQQSVKTIPSIRHFTETLLKDGVDPMLPYLSSVEAPPGPDGKPKSNIQVEGLAVFKKDRLAGVMKGDQAIALMLVMNQMGTANVQLPAPKGKGTLQIQFQEGQTVIKPKMEGEHIRMKMEVRVRAWLVENESNYDLTANGNIERTEKILSRKIEAEVENTLHRLQTELGSDPVGFGEMIHREYPDRWKEIKKDWTKGYYPKVKLDVSANIHLEHTGAITKPVGRNEGVMLP